MTALVQVLLFLFRFYLAVERRKSRIERQILTKGHSLNELWVFGQLFELSGLMHDDLINYIAIKSKKTLSKLLRFNHSLYIQFILESIFIIYFLLSSNMSKLNIRFIYRNQQEQDVKPVKSLHKGPINLSNLYETYVNPSYHEIEIDQSTNPVNENKQPQTATFRKQMPTTSSIQVESKPTSPKSPIQKILKEPQNATNQDHLSAQTKTKKTKRIQSLKPTFKIQESEEKQLIRKSQNKKTVRKSTQDQVPDGQMKSPSFKYIPKQQGQINHCTRKEYVRAQKVQKYLYNGIPQKSEDDFVGCFGCLDTKQKAFQARHNK